MARKCSICEHKDRQKIDLLLVNSEALRKISKRFFVSITALSRHKDKHLPEALSKSKEAKDIEQADQIMIELERCLKRVNKLFDACHEWLTDPVNPEKYTLVPRSDDVDIIYLEYDTDGKPIRRKAKMSNLLALINEKGLNTVSWETRSADPRELILKTAGRLGDLLELLKDIKESTELGKEIAELKEIIEGMKAKGK